MTKLTHLFAATTLALGLAACSGDDGSTTTTTTTNGSTAGSTGGSSTGASSTTGMGSSTGVGSDTGTGGGGDLYGDPMNGCQPNEDPLQVMGLEGAFCSPQCDDMGMCPPAPAGVDATPQCALGADPNMPTNCALICVLDNNSADCPAGATCKDVMQMGLGICTYP